MIVNFLIKALCEKESVYVNNLGLFRKEYEPAQIKDGVITPPGHKVVFDPDFDGNGFAFTMFVSQKGGLLITDATMRIDQWVEQLKTALDNNKSVSFENFGTFAKNDKGIIVYQCDRIAELNVGYEGMEPLVIGKQTSQEEEEIIPDESIDKEEFKNNNELEEIEEHDNKEIVEVVDENHVTEVKNGNETDEKEEDENADNGPEKEEDGKKRTWLIPLIITLIIALLAAAAYYFRESLKEVYQQYFEKTTIVNEEPVQETPEPITVITPDSTLMSDSLTATDDGISTDESTNLIEEQPIPISVDPNQNTSTFTSQLPDGEKLYINYEKGKYYVIVGSFRSEKEVRQHIKERKLEQYHPKVVMQPNSKNLRICIGVFDTEAAADNYGRSTSLNYWVLK